VAQVDRETCVLLEAAFYGAAEAPLKRLRTSFASSAKQRERWLLSEDRPFSETELNRGGAPMGTSMAGGR